MKKKRVAKPVVVLDIIAIQLCMRKLEASRPGSFSFVFETMEGDLTVYADDVDRAEMSVGNAYHVDPDDYEIVIRRKAKRR